ncbi:SCP-like protein [Ancylostoma duodenale]|uniref:SCP-like protein n=1 Tax=Ancylostoma duodenale TaxID=51022 RepID=A0A0C2FX41_9BILA|nr:SCP-like protein [Ancylostoma duodenale]
MGQVTKRNNNYMPRASNMIELKYDCTLEVAARDRAQSCATDEIRGGLENKHMVAVSSVKNRIEAMEKGVKQWWKQVRKDTPLGMAVTFRDHHQYLPIRSFTRMAWANTQKIGCAVKRCGEQWNVVCHYDPAGNIVNQPIYVRGKPCSQCPSRASCSNALCVLP